MTITDNTPAPALGRTGRPVRSVLPIRVDKTKISIVERLAAENGVDRSEMSRRLMDEALAARGLIDAA